MPFGTTEIADSSRELSTKIDLLIESMRILQQGTVQLAQNSGQFADYMKVFTIEMHGMNEQFHAMTAGIESFQHEMQTMTTQIKEMATATYQMGAGLTEEIRILSGTLQELGKSFAQSMVENMKSNLKEFVGFDKFKDLLPKSKKE